MFSKSICIVNERTYPHGYNFCTFNSEKITVVLTWQGMYFVFLFKEKLEAWLTSLRYSMEKEIKKNPEKFTLNTSKNYILMFV